MIIKYQNVTLRDYIESDIADEIRWFNKETAWMLADTPWETFELVDEEELKKQMLYIMSTFQADSVRTRLEIDVEGKHIGFISYYLLDDNFDVIPYNQNKNGSKKYCALGIEICEPSYWSKGLGAKALVAAINYYKDNDFNDFCLETWSGNVRMLKCAEKLGFYICKRKPNFRKVNGKDYDAVTLLLDNKAFEKKLF